MKKLFLSLFFLPTLLYAGAGYVPGPVIITAPGGFTLQPSPSGNLFEVTDPNGQVIFFVSTNGVGGNFSGGTNLIESAYNFNITSEIGTNGGPVAVYTNSIADNTYSVLRYWVLVAGQTNNLSQTIDLFVRNVNGTAEILSTNLHTGSGVGGAATNVVWPVAGTGVTLTTNALEVTINANVTSAALASSTNVILQTATNSAAQYMTNFVLASTNTAVANSTNLAKTYGDNTFALASQTNALLAGATNSAKSYTDNATNGVMAAATNSSAQYMTNFVLASTNSIMTAATNSAKTYADNATNGVMAAATNSAKSYADSTFWPKTTDIVTNNAPSLVVTNLTVYGAANFQGTNGTSSFDTVVITNGLTAGTIIGQGDGVTNTSGYSLSSMADTNWVLQQVSSYGMHVYSSGTTNTGALAGRTNNWQGWAVPVLTVTTNSLTGMAQNDYIRTVVSTQTVVRIGDGPVSVNAYLFKGAPGTISIHPEFYLYDTVAETLVEIGAAPTHAITETVPTRHVWSISVSSTNLTNPNKIVWAWKVDSVGANPTLNFISGGQYDSHMSFSENIASVTIQASQIVGGGNLIYSNAATARVNMSTNSANSTNFFGQLSNTNLAAGVNADSSSFWRGDYNWITSGNLFYSNAATARVDMATNAANATNFYGTITASKVSDAGNLVYSNAATARVDMATNAANATNIYSPGWFTTSNNVGQITMQQASLTNISGNITLDGALVGYTAGRYQNGVLTVTNSTSTDYSVTVPSTIQMATNSFVLGQVVWVTNYSVVDIAVECRFGWTNGAAIRFPKK